MADGILDRLVHNAHRIEIRGGFDVEESRETKPIAFPSSRSVAESEALLIGQTFEVKHVLPSLLAAER